MIARIKVAIDHYGITSDQLGLDRAAVRDARSTEKRTAHAAVAKYQDGQGNSWSGRGPRPYWLRDALKNGRSLEDFASSPVAAQKAGIGKGAKKRKSKAKFRDAAGHEWSGMGPRPGWLKDALAAGQTLEQLAA